MMVEIDRDKLAKLLGMLGSDHDGEVLAAARKVHIFVRNHKLTWQEILRQEVVEEEDDDEVVFFHREAERILDQYRHKLTKWEVDFFEDIQHWTKLTEKQQKLILKIRRRLDGY